MVIVDIDNTVKDFIYTVNTYKPLLNHSLEINLIPPISINEDTRYTLGNGVSSDEWFNVIGLCSFVLFIITTDKKVYNPFCYHIKGDMADNVYRYIMFDNDFKNLSDLQVRRIVTNSCTINIIKMIYNEKNS